MKSAYTLSIEKNFALRILFARRGMNPIMAMKDVLSASAVKGAKRSESAAKTLLDRPIDLSLRQLSFAAKTIGMEFEDLLESVLEGVGSDSITTWKQRYMLEKQRNKEFKTIIGQKNDEIQTASKKIAIFRNVLHEKGIQDPTVQSREGIRNGEADADNSQDGQYGHS